MNLDTFSVNRSLRWLCAGALLAFLGCGRQSTPSSDAKDGSTANEAMTDVAVQLNWFPEAEHGGVYQAVADGTYEAVGLKVEIRPGGSATPIAPELVLGRCQFAITNADDVVLFREQGADIVAVLAAMQNHPRCILVRTDSPAKSLSELAGMTLQRQNGRPYLEFMRSKGLLENVKEVPYHGSVAALVTDPNVAIQGYSFAEPLLAKQQGAEVRVLMLSDLGWNPYSSVLVTSGELIRSNPQLVAQFVKATQAGWKNYLTSGELGNEKILAANTHGMTAEALQFGSDGLRQLAMPGDFAIDQVGSMTSERWENLVSQMTELKLVDPNKVKASDCFTTQFIESPATVETSPAAP